MKVEVGFRDESRAVGTLTADGSVRWTGPGAAAVESIVTRYGKDGAALLEMLPRVMRGSWWAVRLSDKPQPPTVR